MGHWTLLGVFEDEEIADLGPRGIAREKIGLLVGGEIRDPDQSPRSGAQADPLICEPPSTKRVLPVR